MTYKTPNRGKKQRKKSFDRRMQYNSRNNNLTKEQHYALMSLCSWRHSMHSNQRMTWRGFDNSCWELLPCGENAGLINITLTNAGLPALDIEDSSSVCTESTWYTEYSDTDRYYWETLAVANGYGKTQSFEYWEAVQHRRMIDYFEKTNAIIEKYLKTIDRKCGTNYAPTGAMRSGIRYGVQAAV